MGNREGQLQEMELEGPGDMQAVIVRITGVMGTTEEFQDGQ